MPHELPVPAWHPDLEIRHAALVARLAPSLPCLELPLHLPWIDAIQRLKALRGAVILAHSYQSPEIFHAVADLTGDSLALARAAAEVEAGIIVLCGVHFMAETAKILAPDKTVLIPDPEAGCSLAASVCAEDVRGLRARHPGVPVVSYVNTSAEVKAESDACCTSGNAVEVVEALGSDRVIFLPDRFLGAHVAARTGIELILWDGRCEVHERFTAGQARHARERFQAMLVAHPECPPEVLAEADFVGSTSAMGDWLARERFRAPARLHARRQLQVHRLARERPPRVALITECAMADNLRVRFPEIEFVQPCNLCPHMKRITLPNIHACLRDLAHEVHVEPRVAARARVALERMLAGGRDKAQQATPSENPLT
ncbi:MAG TPA: quinolinate synthase [Xanthomonadaceae bacterium]|nr:quinolinate synthase [Xanthomonadaceae bacterium]